MGEEFYVKEIFNRLKDYPWFCSVEFIDDKIVIFIEGTFFERCRFFSLMNDYAVPYKVVYV